MSTSEKFHHHLISGEIVFVHQDAPDQPSAIRLNGVLIDKSRDLPTRLLGKAQQILQLNFHNRTQDEKVKVVDVILMGFSYLGEFTQEEFQAPPEGMKLQERAEAAPAQMPLDLEQAVAQAESKAKQEKAKLEVVK